MATKTLCAVGAAVSAAGWTYMADGHDAVLIGLASGAVWFAFYTIITGRLRF